MGSETLLAAFKYQMFTKEGKFQSSFNVNILKPFNPVSAHKTQQYIKGEHVMTEVIT